MKKVFLLTAIFNIAIVGYSQSLIVAVQEFTARSGYSAEELESITELFAGILLETGKVRVLTRNSSQWQSILKEHGFQRDSGLVDPSEIRQLGRALGAKAVVTGTMGALGNTNFLNTSILDVESGEMLSTARKTFATLDEFIDKILPSLAADVVKLLEKHSPLIGKWRSSLNWYGHYIRSNLTDVKLETIIEFKQDGTFHLEKYQLYVIRDENGNFLTSRDARVFTFELDGLYWLVDDNKIKLAIDIGNNRILNSDTVKYWIKEEGPYHYEFNREKNSFKFIDSTPFMATSYYAYDKFGEIQYIEFFSYNK